LSYLKSIVISLSQYTTGTPIGYLHLKPVRNCPSQPPIGWRLKSTSTMQHTNNKLD
jgi:hypothetical protein